MVCSSSNIVRVSYQTQADSRDKIVLALSGWIKGESAGCDDFNWLSIGDWFNRE
jgi:hypothetical protein